MQNFFVWMSNECIYLFFFKTEWAFLFINVFLCYQIYVHEYFKLNLRIRPFLGFYFSSNDFDFHPPVWQQSPVKVIWWSFAERIPLSKSWGAFEQLPFAWEMKGGYNFRLMGKPISLTLAALICTTILLWAWEKNPFADTLLLAREHFTVPSIGLFADPYVCSATCVSFLFFVLFSMKLAALFLYLCNN